MKRAEVQGQKLKVLRIMKRLFLTVMAVLGIAVTTFAEGEKMNGADNASAYEMTVNYASLSRTLNLTDEQAEAVEEIHGAFCADMAAIASADKASRRAMMDNAVVKELRMLRLVLDRDQYRKYLMLLNATINNRGLNE